VRDEDDRHAFAEPVAEVPADLVPARVAQVVVDENDVGPLGEGGRNRLGARRCFDAPIPGAQARRRNQHSETGVVVGDEDQAPVIFHCLPVFDPDSYASSDRLCKFDVKGQADLQVWCAGPT
jgi:hypothetical protein